MEGWGSNREYLIQYGSAKHVDAVTMSWRYFDKTF